ncbi:hypothetical protein Asppvi_007249 [Aspergillus pseudoviridinutans]|uniref:Uncharacterized protein n=1 Tax=Aspergillus pseudoviridinutans TaxID=1517512 RepID=A0A9P3EUC3_9EURO|nr:uncharacterized protein Asppvi_007249 [Aspergillus pseudoviridinutans]GIJ88329.1 hypothetical protein Asppvi_007249 [Aspergillus pseudoviridinutans]
MALPVVILGQKQDHGVRMHHISLDRCFTWAKTSEGHRLVPYLAGWGYARISMVELCSLMMMTRRSSAGNRLWRTISSIFKKEVDKVASSGKLPEPVRIRKALLDRAREDIPREMGESYARAVARCLLPKTEAQTLRQQRGSIAKILEV